MPPWASRTGALLSRLNQTAGHMIAWLAVLMTLAQLLAVMLLFFFSEGSIKLQESIIYMHGALFMLAAGYTLRHDGHVRVDIFHSRAGERRRALIDLGGALFFLLPVCALIVISALPYAAASWRIGEGSRETSGLQIVYLLKSVIPLTGLLLGAQGLSLAISCAQTLLRNR